MSKLVEKIKALPPMDDTIIRIEDICSNPYYNIDDLVAVIAKDPMLVANVLRFANSPLYNFRSEISNLKQAISLFGIHAIKGFIFYIFTQKTFNADLSVYNTSNSYFLRCCAAQLAFALNWSVNEPADIIKVLLPATFLCDIGRTVIAHEIAVIGKKNEFKEKVKAIEGMEELRDLEKFYVGIDSADLTVEILKIWKMDSKVVQTICDADPENEKSFLKPACYLSVIKTFINIFGMYQEDALIRARALVEHYKLDLNLFEDVLKINQEL